MALTETEERPSEPEDERADENEQQDDDAERRCTFEGGVVRLSG